MWGSGIFPPWSQSRFCTARHSDLGCVVRVGMDMDFPFWLRQERRFSSFQHPRGFLQIVCLYSKTEIWARCKGSESSFLSFPSVVPPAWAPKVSPRALWGAEHPLPQVWAGFVPQYPLHEPSARSRVLEIGFYSGKCFDLGMICWCSDTLLLLHGNGMVCNQPNVFTFIFLAWGEWTWKWWMKWWKDQEKKEKTQLP